MRKILLGNIILRDSIIEHGYVEIEGDKIVSVGEGKKYKGKDAELFDFSNLYISPGFIDVHIHGSFGRDVIDGESESLEIISQFIAKHGTTGFLPTIVTAPLKDMRKSVENIENFIERKNFNGAKILGIHLEGPFLNAKYKGAQREDCLLPPKIEYLEELISENLKLMTIAPEIEGSFDIIRYLSKRNVKISAGHTDATAEIIEHAISLGLSHVTHLFNGMRPLHHRDPGIIGVSLINDQLSVEIIADGYHLADHILTLVTKVKPKEKVILITDAIEAAGLPDGDYELSKQKVIVKNGKATLENGTLAGSSLTLNKAVKNMVERAKLDIKDAVFMASYSPAKFLGLENKGSIEVGKDADITVFDKNFDVAFTMVEGTIVYRKSLK